MICASLDYTSIAKLPSSNKKRGLFVNSYGEILRIFFVLFYRTLECLSILFCTAHSTFLVVENVEYAPPEVHEVPKTVADSF